MPLSEHVYCVAVTFKMTEQVEQRNCMKFCVKLEHSSTKTIWMIQKAAAMGNWWLAASSGKCARSCIRSHAVFWWLNSKHPGDSALLQPRFGALRLLAFTKLKSPLKGKRFQTVNSGKYDGAADGNWENCVKSQGAYFEGDWGIIALYTRFLVSSSTNVYFS